MTTEDRAILREALAALEMPERGLQSWLCRLDRFCQRHGGARSYRELRQLVASCQAALDEER